MNCLCETTTSARLWLYLKRLYFISSAIAYCISPYASFYAGLSCLMSFRMVKKTDLSQPVFVWSTNEAFNTHTHTHTLTHTHTHTRAHAHARTLTHIHAHTQTRTHSAECNSQDFHAFNFALKHPLTHPNTP